MGPCHTAVPVFQHLQGTFFAESLVGRLHAGFAEFVNVRVILTQTCEYVHAALAIQCFRGEPAVTAEPAISVDPLFSEILEVCDFLRLHFNHVNVEIISLRMDRRGRRKTHDDHKDPNGSLEHDLPPYISETLGRVMKRTLHPGKGSVKSACPAGSEEDAEDFPIERKFVDATGKSVGNIEDLIWSGRDAESPRRARRHRARG